MAADADEAVGEIEKTHRRAKDLDTEIQNMLKKIQGKEKFSSTCWYLPELKYLQNV